MSMISKNKNIAYDNGNSVWFELSSEKDKLVRLKEKLWLNIVVKKVL